MLLDSTFLADFLRGENKAKDKVVELNSTEEPLITSAICIAEISAGMKNYSEDKKKKVKETLENLTTIPVTFTIAFQAGEISSNLKKIGLEIELPDCIIAATALEKEEIVLTRNVNHFQRIKNLKVETY